MSDLKPRKKKKWLFPLVLLIAVVVLLLFFFISRSGLASLSGHAFSGQAGSVSVSSGQSAPLDASTAQVTRGSIIVTAEGSGSVEAASTKAVALEYDGKLETVYVETGDQVAAGDVLAVYDQDALDTVIKNRESELSDLDTSISSESSSGSTYITAPVSGRVKRIYAAAGDVAAEVTSRNGGVAEISADGKLKLEFTCETSLSPGDTVTVEFDNQTVDGTVEEIAGDQVKVTIQDDTEYQVDTTATIRGKSSEILGEGLLESNHPYLVEAAYGVIDSVEVTRESYVDEGETLFTRTDADYNRDYLRLLSEREELVSELKELRAYRDNPEVISEYDGYIVSLDAMEGMTYEKDQQFCTIADASTLYLKVEIDELDIDGIQIGQTAQVVFDAFEEETYTGTIEKISGVGNNTGGVTTYTVTIAMEGDAHLKDSMSATAVITTEEKEDVLLIPVDAILSQDGQRYVQVLANGQTEQRLITLGLVNDSQAEVTGGLTEGETILINEPEQSSSNTALMNMGGSGSQGGNGQ